MEKAIRQGDVCLILTDKLPLKLKASATNVLLSVGSGGNPHTFKGGKFYPKIKGDFIIGYLEAQGTKIYHKEHSAKGEKIDDGIYEVRRQVEWTHEGLRPIVD